MGLFCVAIGLLSILMLVEIQRFDNAQPEKFKQYCELFIYSIDAKLKENTIERQQEKKNVHSAACSFNVTIEQMIIGVLFSVRVFLCITSYSLVHAKSIHTLN